MFRLFRVIAVVCTIIVGGVFVNKPKPPKNVVNPPSSGYGADERRDNQNSNNRNTFRQNNFR